MACPWRHVGDEYFDDYPFMIGCSGIPQGVACFRLMTSLRFVSANEK